MIMHISHAKANSSVRLFEKQPVAAVRLCAAERRFLWKDEITKNDWRDSAIPLANNSSENARDFPRGRFIVGPASKTLAQQ